MQRTKVEAARFLVVGAANFVLTFAIFYVFVRVVHANHLVALTAAWGLGTVFSYALNYVWTFQPEERLNFRARFAKYVAAGLAALLFNLVALEVAVTGFGWDAFWAQCVLMPFVIVFNFVTAKFWSLRRSQR